ncbi:MAG TPA: IS4/IS5 family transposase, partial [Candidatus Dependentiae bacterium]|nr:IS4/IS5 family transposase [Candidatus Dependentiae bacterium]
LTSILQDAQANGWIDHTPHFTTVIKYFNQPEITNFLLTLIEETSKELALIEKSFSIDATGFTSTMYKSWSGIRYEEPGRKRQFKKVHIMIGNKTQIITAIKVTHGHAADTKQFPNLLKSTANNFRVQKVCADKAYLSIKNYELSSKEGAIPYIPFKEISTRKHGKPRIWKTMYREFKEYPEHYNKAYHERSQVESTFSSIKRKFGERLFTRNNKAQENEILAKALAHNICTVAKIL